MYELSPVATEIMWLVHIMSLVCWRGVPFAQVIRASWFIACYVSGGEVGENSSSVLVMTRMFVSDCLQILMVEKVQQGVRTRIGGVLSGNGQGLVRAHSLGDEDAARR